MLERGAKIQLINMVSFIFCLFYVKTIKHVVFILYNCQVTGHSVCCYRSHSTGSLPHPVYLNTCSSASPLTITHYPDPRRLNSLAHNMIFRAAPLKLYAIFVFLFVLPVVQVTDVVEVPSLVSRYIKLFPGSPSQSQQNRRSLPVKMKKSHNFQLLPCFL